MDKVLQYLKEHDLINIRKWSVSDVASWLARCSEELGSFAGKFQKELVKGNVLFDIDVEDLKEEFQMEFGIRKQF